MTDDLFTGIGSGRLERQLRFLTEIDKAKLILRRTLLTDGSRRENDAEHSWHLAVMAAVLQEHAREPFSMERVLKMTLIHDLVEIYAGDTFAFDTAANAGKEDRETAAADRLFALLPPDQGQELRALWEEFDAMETADARYAAALDRLQPFLHNLCTQGAHLGAGKSHAAAGDGTLRAGNGSPARAPPVDGSADSKSHSKRLDPALSGAKRAFSLIPADAGLPPASPCLPKPAATPAP